MLVFTFFTDKCIAMKKAFIVLSFCLFDYTAFCQLEFRESNVGRMGSFVDFNGRSLMKKYDGDIAGSPFINENWEKAILTLSKGKKTSPVLIKMNIENNELNYMDSSGKEFIADARQVKRVDYISFYTKDSMRYIFKNGYPAIYNQDTSFYYQVYTEGKIELLGKKTKYIRTYKHDVTGETTKEFLDAAIVFYVYTRRTMEEFHPYKSFILTVMRDKEQAVATYMSDNKVNLKKTSHLIKLFNYYNSL